MAIIRIDYQDGKKIYKVVHNRSVEYSTTDATCAEKFCEDYYGCDWGWE